MLQLCFRRNILNLLFPISRTISNNPIFASIIFYPKRSYSHLATRFSIHNGGMWFTDKDWTCRILLAHLHAVSQDRLERGGTWCLLDLEADIPIDGLTLCLQLNGQIEHRNLQCKGYNFVSYVEISRPRKNRYGKFYPKKVFQKKLSTNKSSEKFYPEVLSKIFFIQNVHNLFYITL